LFDMPSELAILFNKKSINKLVDEHMKGRHDWSWFIWAIYSLVNWQHKYRDGN